MKPDRAFCRKRKCQWLNDTNSKVVCAYPCDIDCDQKLTCNNCKHAQVVPKDCAWYLEYTVRK